MDYDTTLVEAMDILHANTGQMLLFQGLRKNPPAEYKEKGMTTEDGIDFEGVVFADRTCAVRRRTRYRSTTLWDSFKDFYMVHGHSEYGSTIIWIGVSA